MARKNGNKKWTYSGIKAYFPRLSFSEWLGICKRKDHFHPDPCSAVFKVNWKNC